METAATAFGLLAIIPQCLESAKLLYDLRTSYEQASHLFTAIYSESLVIAASLSQVNALLQSDALQNKPVLFDTIDQAFTGCQLVFAWLQKEVKELDEKTQALNPNHDMGFTDRARYVWKEGTFKELLQQIRGQQTTLSLLIQCLQMESMVDIKQTLERNTTQLEELMRQSQHLRETHPNLDVPKSIFDKESTVQSPSDIQSALSSAEFAFDDQVINSQAYRRAMALATLRAQNKEPMVEVVEGDLIDLTSPIDDDDEDTVQGQPLDGVEEVLDSAIEELKAVDLTMQSPKALSNEPPTDTLSESASDEDIGGEHSELLDALEREMLPFMAPGPSTSSWSTSSPPAYDSRRSTLQDADSSRLSPQSTRPDSGVRTFGVQQVITEEDPKKEKTETASKGEEVIPRTESPINEWNTPQGKVENGDHETTPTKPIGSGYQSTFHGEESSKKQMPAEENGVSKPEIPSKVDSAPTEFVIAKVEPAPTESVVSRVQSTSTESSVSNAEAAPTEHVISKVESPPTENVISTVEPSTQTDETLKGDSDLQGNVNPKEEEASEEEEAPPPLPPRPPRTSQALSPTTSSQTNDETASSPDDDGSMSSTIPSTSITSPTASRTPTSPSADGFGKPLRKPLPLTHRASEDILKRKSEKLLLYPAATEDPEMNKVWTNLIQEEERFIERLTKFRNLFYEPVIKEWPVLEKHLELMTIGEQLIPLHTKYLLEPMKAQITSKANACCNPSIFERWARKTSTIYRDYCQRLPHAEGALRTTQKMDPKFSPFINNLGLSLIWFGKTWEDYLSLPLTHLNSYIETLEVLIALNQTLEDYRAKLDEPGLKITLSALQSLRKTYLRLQTSAQKREELSKLDRRIQTLDAGIHTRLSMPSIERRLIFQGGLAFKSHGHGFWQPVHAILLDNYFLWGMVKLPGMVSMTRAWKKAARKADNIWVMEQPISVKDLEIALPGTLEKKTEKSNVLDDIPSKLTLHRFYAKDIMAGGKSKRHFFAAYSEAECKEWYKKLGEVAGGKGVHYGGESLELPAIERGDFLVELPSGGREGGTTELPTGAALETTELPTR